MFPAAQTEEPEAGGARLNGPTLLQCPLQNVSESAEAGSPSGQPALA